MCMEDIKQYYGKEVRLLLDGRGYETGKSRGVWKANANVSVEINGTVIGETERFLNLKDVYVLNLEPIHYEFTNGSINKDYIIGIFEGLKKE